MHIEDLRTEVKSLLRETKHRAASYDSASLPAHVSNDEDNLARLLLLIDAAIQWYITTLETRDSDVQRILSISRVLGIRIDSVDFGYRA